jgi:hypothetical protein
MLVSSRKGSWPCSVSSMRDRSVLRRIANLAVALAHAGRLDEAIAHVEEAARLAPADTAIQELFQQLLATRSVNR